MGELLDRHLDAVARRMGGFLRGFDDPRVHLGSAARFAAEFRKVIDYPALHAPGDLHAISYLEAVKCCRVPVIAAAYEDPPDPVSTMILGLGGFSLLSAGARQEIPPDALRKDLSVLLRTPLLLFYLQISDRDAFYGKLGDIAAREAFPLVTPATPGNCPTCGALLSPDRHSRLLDCGNCRQAFESIHSLPMVSGVVARVSYEMLRRAAALDLVISYQEEGKIMPLWAGGETS